MNGWHVFYKTCIVLATAAALVLLWYLAEILLVLFIAIIFASTVRPYANFLTARGMPQGVAVVLLYLLIFGALLGLIIVSVPPLATFTLDILAGDLLIRQVQSFMGSVLLFFWQKFNMVVPVMQVPDQLRGLLLEANDTAREQALPVAMTTLTGVGQFFLALVMSFYWLTNRERFLETVLHLSPVRHRAKTLQVWTDIEQTLGAYVRGQAILMLAVGIASFIGLLLLGVPYALPLAVVAGLTEAIPVVGPIIGAVPAVLIAFSVSPITGLLVVALYLVIQQLESNVLVPKVMESNVGVNSLVVVVALVAGGTLNGVVGAILAIPIAGALQVLIQHFVIEPALHKNQWRTDSGGVLIGESDPNAESKTPPQEPTIILPSTVRSSTVK